MTEHRGRLADGAPAGQLRWSNRRVWSHAVMAWIAARCCVALGIFVAHLSGPTSAAARLHLHEGLLTWDGTFYREIATHGYGSTVGESIRFFPLYPVISRLFSWPLGIPAGLLIVSNGLALVAFVALAQLVVRTTEDEDLAVRSIWVMALFPAAGVFVAAYSESLALVCVLLCLLAARDRRWLWAALAALGAGLARPLGVLVVIPLAAQAWDHRAEIHRRGSETVAAVVALVSAPAGLIAFFVWTGIRYDEWVEPLRIQRRLRGGFQDPLSRLFVAIGRTASGSGRDAYNLAFALLFIVAMVIALRTQRWGWSAYALTTVGIALASHNIDSMGRYGLMAFPLVVAGASALRGRWALRCWLALSACGLVGFTVATMAGSVVP